jgi:hypothetical protein
MSDAKRIANVERSLASLQKRVSALEAMIRAPRQKDITPIGKDHDSQEQKDAASESIAIQAAPSNRKETDQAGNHPVPRWGRIGRIVVRVRKWPHWMQVLQVSGIVFGIVYAIVTCLQWYDLRHNFRTDERSWIDPGINIRVIPVDGTGTIKLTNVGKSPILSTVTDAWVEILDRHSPPSLAKEGFHSVSDTGWIFPGKETDIFIQRYTQDSKHAPFPPTDDERKALISGEDYVATYGQIIYEDQFGIHWERFCVWKGFVNNGPMVNVGDCGAFNAMGDDTNREGTDIPDWPKQKTQ